MQKTIKTLCLSIALAIVSLSTTSASFARQPDTQIVRNDPGGRVIDYAIRLKHMERDQRMIRFEGRCDSACTLFLALPAARTCVTRQVRFGFHLPFGSSPKGNHEAEMFLLNSYPGWVRSWLQANGGLTSQLKIMPYDYARQHLGTCESV